MHTVNNGTGIMYGLPKLETAVCSSAADGQTACGLSV